MVRSPKSDELKRVLLRLPRLFRDRLMFSLAINLLYLAAPLYMLQVYDRVISSASQVTLVMLTIVLLVAFVALAGLDAVRARVLTRASIRLDRLVAGRVDDARSSIARRASEARAASCCATSIPSGSSSPAPGIHAVFDLPVGADLHPGHFRAASVAGSICFARAVAADH